MGTGRFGMRVLLISDIHSNLEAFEEVLNHASFDEALFIGDLVDYGPNPFEVFEVLQYVRARRVLGNHDAAAAFRSDCRSSRAMHEASVVTRKLITWKQMPEKSLETLGKAEKEVRIDYAGLKVRAFHAAPDDRLYRYITKEEAGQMDMKGADVVVLGHTHVAYEIRQNGVWVVNPGSVGMPKDGDPRASYAVLDTTSRSVAFGRVKYDIDEVISKLKGPLRERPDVFETVATTLKNA
jgi:putative phosphoesterase